MAALCDALVDLFEKPRIAVLMLEALAAVLSCLAVGDDGGTGGILRALPGVPRLAFDELELLQFAKARPRDLAAGSTAG